MAAYVNLIVVPSQIDRVPVACLFRQHRGFNENKYLKINAIRSGMFVLCPLCVPSVSDSRR